MGLTDYDQDMPTRRFNNWVIRYVGVYGISQLLVPINVSHWQFLRVNVGRQRIEVWDSLGADSANLEYAHNSICAGASIVNCSLGTVHHPRSTTRGHCRERATICRTIAPPK